MILDSHICLIASGATGQALTHDLDCSVWAFRGPEGWLVFDTGAGVDTGAMLERMAFCGIAAGDVAAVLLTHAHADHSGGAAALMAKLPRARLLSGAETARILAGRDERLISLDKARGHFYPLDYEWTPPEVDEVLAPAQAHRLAGLEVTLLETPGHSADHCCYRVRGDGIDALVAGDAVFAGGRVILQDIEDCSVSASIASIRKLAGLDFESFFAGHGGFSLRGGRRHVEAAMVHAGAGLPPPQL
ncbi:hydrolase 11 (probable hydroxyacylglutathione hydrolase) [Oceanicola granulosus HTCC2516]|uniref:Hydrolase 11 (Probable hydroxyacylglutathione hydrolase) n=1 Tax=Oceanicola granulosus (strain ATCC BAA-861 / DSM 15982 / KCTC 12143 / HTCC2516) TaxID=314256 RepID=Q2CF40_OCEGH|nr:MBL fold metallo-hydrolase [Oceanicola granulosus]EAR51287.1 hydrolase 11 (probable hydroxyacylglutathione hydrolase) [Oceanicola granulosus HTCC2516]